MSNKVLAVGGPLGGKLVELPPPGTAIAFVHEGKKEIPPDTVVYRVVKDASGCLFLEFDDGSMA